MRKSVLIAVASFSLLAACGQNETQSNGPAANQAAVSTDAQPNDLVPMAALATREESLKVMHERHEGMEQIGKSTKTIKRALDSSAPDVATIQKAATTIADLATKTPGWFPAGTGPELGKTGAKPEIWQNQADFSAKDRDFRKAALAMNAASAGGNLDAIKSGFADLGKSCKACHDKYRSDMHH
ncbi:MAG: cytochrome c [Sphingomonas sp.]|nr:cytochrome c [Sphingomonas sp.]